MLRAFALSVGIEKYFRLFYDIKVLVIQVGLFKVNAADKKS